MNIINLNQNRKKNGIEDLLDWLSSDINKLNSIILELMSNNLPLISQLSSHLLESGGKRIRPLLLLACSRLCNYSGDRHIKLASVVEFIHTATLLHDDVVDKGKKRRGKKTANLIWDNKSSILVGDYLLSKAFKILINDGSLSCLNIVSKASLKISEGEVKQLVASKNLKTSEAEYLDIITHKTAELFSAACELSAEISGICEENKRSLSDFGKYVGIAFQIIDDTLDYFSIKGLSGKDFGNYLREGKMYLPLILCYKRSNTEEKKYIEYLLNNNLKDEDFFEILSCMKKYEVENDCKNKAKHFSIMAKDSLGGFSDSDSKNKLVNLVDFLVNRTN